MLSASVLEKLAAQGQKSAGGGAKADARYHKLGKGETKTFRIIQRRAPDAMCLVAGHKHFNIKRFALNHPVNSCPACEELWSIKKQEREDAEALFKSFGKKQTIAVVAVDIADPTLTPRILSLGINADSTGPGIVIRDFILKTKGACLGVENGINVAVTKPVKDARYQVAPDYAPSPLTADPAVIARILDQAEALELDREFDVDAEQLGYLQAAADQIRSGVAKPVVFGAPPLLSDDAKSNGPAAPPTSGGVAPISQAAVASAPATPAQPTTESAPASRGSLQALAEASRARQAAGQ